MKKSNIFTGAERTLGILEYQIDRLRTEYKEANEELKTVIESFREKETEIDPSDYMYSSRTDSKESAEVALDLMEYAYNYIYENFTKLTKEYK